MLLVMDTLHGWIEISFVILLGLSSHVHGSPRSICAKTDTNTTGSITLNCSINQMIHVISELYGERTSEDDCRVRRIQSHAKYYTDDSNGLIVNCNGQQICSEQTSCGVFCKGSGNAYEIAYECVEDSKDICTVLNQTGPLPSLYINSQSFKDMPEMGQSCECSVLGQSLDVLMIEHRGREGVFQITTIGADKKTWASNYIHFNRNIALAARSVMVSFKNATDRRFWIRISGNITHITCGNPTIRKPPTSTSTVLSSETTKPSSADHSHQPGMTSQSFLYPADIESSTDTRSRSSEGVSSTTTAGSNAQSTETVNITQHRMTQESITVMTVSAVCGVIIFLLLVIIGLLLVYFMVIKPKRQRAATNNNTEERVIYDGPDQDNTSGSNEQRNMYSDLVRYENQDNNYGKLHLYANPEFDTGE